MTNTNNLTQEDMWDQGYQSRNEFSDIDFSWRNRTNLLVAREIESVGLENKSILEIGAGDSAWLPYLAKKYPDSRFAGLDYSEAGCARLAERLKSSGLSADVFREDFFAPSSPLHGKFDLVLSFGVVEHFLNLPDALSAKKKFIKQDGLLFTLIPNMAGAIGLLTKLYNRKVFDRHNAHDWNSFRDGHDKAGLRILSGGYLGSSNFGVLSSCFTKHSGFGWHSYVLLTRLTKMLSFIENKLGDFPVSKAFSPIIYAISRVKN